MRLSFEPLLLGPLGLVLRSGGEEQCQGVWLCCGPGGGVGSRRGPCAGLRRRDGDDFYRRVADGLAAAESAASVLCTDLSEPMLARARRKASRLGLSNIEFAIRDITALPDPDGAFDVVIAANVLHLLPQPGAAVRELWRGAAPGGRLILPTFLQGRVGTAYGTMIKIYQGVGFHYEHAFTPETYRDFLEGLGLGPVQVEVIPGRVPEGIAVMKKRGGAGSEGAWSGAKARAQSPQSGVGACLSRSESDRTS